MQSEPIAKLKNMVRSNYGTGITDEVVIHAEVDTLRPVVAPNATDEEVAQLKRELSSELYITVDRGVAITSKDLEPWLADKKSTISWQRWEAYRQYLLNEGRPPGVVSRMDEDTDQILDLMGDPSDPGPWQRRGLVIGDVQSGKTSTYLGLLNKAVDAGFRVIILLGGHTESLRQQTQERVDAGFLGYDTEVAAASNVRNNKRPLGVGLLNKSIQSPQALTTRAQDYSKKSNRGTVIQLETAPAVFVVKKNLHVFDAVNALLGQQHAEGSKISEPVLILDDESDYASVNTANADKDPTKINDRIKTMLAHSERGMYVAFTATPFANIFIDPDQPQDLFPQDLIYALESPTTTYFGAARTFNPEGAQNDPTVSITDADAFFPPRHKSTLVVRDLPPSLKDAVRAFLIANALRDLRGKETPPERSMLVNVSTFKKVQKQVGDLVDGFFQDQLNAILLHASDPVTRQTTPELIELSRVYSVYFPDSPVPWGQVLEQMPNAVSEIVVKVFNSDSEKELDDNKQPMSLPDRLIAVGGNVLSRGLTLEGLTISYFYRHVRAADTLLQMARWFGYRPGYSDLCRIWIADSSADDFRYIAEAVEELKTELRRMHELELTPRDFGIRVKKHPSALLVTAKNKSRTAVEIRAVVSLLGKRIETSKLSSDPKKISSNQDAFEKLLTAVRGRTRREVGSQLRWDDCPRTVVSDFLTIFEAHPAEELWFGSSLRNYVRDGSWLRLATWDVVVVQGEGSPISINGQTIRPVMRKISEGNAGRLMVSGTKARLAGSPDVRKLIDPDDARHIEEAFNKRRALDNKEATRSVPEVLFYEKLKNPVLMVFPLKRSRNSDSESARFEDTLLIGAKIALPGSADLTGKRNDGDVTYLINRVAQRAWEATDYSVDEGDENDE